MTMTQRTTKHINVAYHFIRKKVASNEATLTNVHTKENTTDILTKGLDVQQHMCLMGKLGIELEGDFSLRERRALPARVPGESAVDSARIKAST
jgi:hypothetical protein